MFKLEHLDINSKIFYRGIFPKKISQGIFRLYPSWPCVPPTLGNMYIVHYIIMFVFISYTDFYQLHSYTWKGKYATNSPFKHKASDYKLDKPIVVGEFATSCSESNSSVHNYKYLYDSGYNGALSWQYNEGGGCADRKEVINKGMNGIKDLNSNGKIKIHL